jgi:hypothetical protein
MRTAMSTMAILFLSMIAGSSAFAQVDLTGEWRSASNEDTVRRANAQLGEFVGLPINEAARRKAESWDAAIQTVPEHQCVPHPMQYAEHGAAMSQMRIWKIVDPLTQQMIALQKRGAWMEPERTIWLDGRSHPPEYAPHTWQGFSTGRWEGNMLTVTTTHLKNGYIQMNGVPASDETIITEHFVRHGTYLTNITVINDPVYLTEPFIRTSTWVLDPKLQFQRYPCGPNEVAVEIPRPAGVIPHHLPGTNTTLDEFAVKTGLPVEATRGGAETTYPEYMERLKHMKPASASAGK